MRDKYTAWTLLIAGILWGCAEATPTPTGVTPQRGVLSFRLTGGDATLVSNSVDMRGRRACKSVMVIPGENVRANKEIVSAIEGHFMSRGSTDLRRSANIRS